MASLYGCEVVNASTPSLHDDGITFSSHFVEQIEKLSRFPVLIVDSRMNGITSGKSGSCYWNASIISQTFGGQVLFGWLIDPIHHSEQSFRLLGHACWITPEGKLVNPTANTEQVYFLPDPSVRLILNASKTEYLKDYFYCEDMPLLSSCISEFAAFPEEDYGRLVLNNQQLKDAYDGVFLNKLVSVSNPCPTSFINELLNSFVRQMGSRLPSPLLEEDQERIGNTMKTIINIFKEGDDKKDYQDSAFSLPAALLKAYNAGTSIGELYPNIHTLSFNMEGSNDPVWDYEYGNHKDNVCGISTATSKTILDYQVHPELVELHSVPKKKKKRRKIEKVAQKFNLTPQEVVLMSNPYLYPHPSLVKKAGGARVPRVA